MQNEPSQETTTFHHRHHHHRGDGLHAPSRHKHNNLALDGHTDFVPHSHSRLYVERLGTVVDLILVCAQGHFLDGHSRRFVNRQHMSLPLATAIDAVVGLHILQSPIRCISGTSATSITLEAICKPDDNHIYSDPLAAAAAVAVVFRAIAAALALSVSALLPAAFSAALIVESAHAGAFAAPWLSRNT